jgi:hypothetical protein
MTQSQMNKYRKHYNDRPNVNRMAAAKSTYPKVAVQWLNQALCIYQSLCLVDWEAARTLNFARPDWR